MKAAAEQSRSRVLQGGAEAIRACERHLRGLSRATRAFVLSELFYDQAIAGLGKDGHTARRLQEVAGEAQSSTAKLTRLLVRGEKRVRR